MFVDERVKKPAQGKNKMRKRKVEKSEESGALKIRWGQKKRSTMGTQKINTLKKRGGGG